MQNVTTDYFIESLAVLLDGDKDLFDVLKKDFNSINPDIENFIRNNAEIATKLKTASTFLVLSVAENQLDFVGYFTLSIKVLRIEKQSLSNTEIKKIQSLSYYDETNDCFNCPAILIAQFGRNFNPNSLSISGTDLMHLTINKINDAQALIGSRLFFLECEPNEKIINFYTNQGFKLLNTKITTKNGKELLQMYQIK